MQEVAKTKIWFLHSTLALCRNNTSRIFVYSHIHETEETPVTQMPIPLFVITKLYEEVTGSHYGDNPLLRPTGIQIATKILATSNHQKTSEKLIRGAKTVSLGSNYTTSSLWSGAVLESELQATEKTVALPNYQSYQK